MIGSSENRISYNGNGIATEFAYTFKILEKSDIKVLHVAIDGTEELLTKDYYVDMEKSVVLYPGYAPGAEIPEQNRPPILPVGERLVIYREVPITQESALDKHWPFNVIEAGLDKLTIICQQLFDRLQRSFYVSESTSTNFDTKVPIEAGKTFRVNDDGTGFEVTEDPVRVQQVAVSAKNDAEKARDAAQLARDTARAWAEENAGTTPSLIGGAKSSKQWSEHIHGYVDTAVEDARIAKETAIKSSEFVGNIVSGELYNIYSSVADMKADTTLMAGQTVKTVGYYEVNDGGGAFYYIRAKLTDDVDDGGSLHELANGLVAELIVENGTINPMLFGAKGNGSDDDTLVLRKVLKYSSDNKVALKFIPNKVHLVTDTLNKADDGTYYNLTFNIVGYNKAGIYAPTYGGIKVANNVDLFFGATFNGDINHITIAGNRSGGSNVFRKSILASCLISRCYFANFDNFGYGLNLESTSKIIKNTFVNVFNFMNYDIDNKSNSNCIDSIISENYINGGKEPTDNVCFGFSDGNGSIITNNFVDYFNTIFCDKNTTSRIFRPPTSIGNHYQVFRHFYRTENATTIHFQSLNDCFNWTDVNNPKVSNVLSKYRKYTYTGKDGETYEIPEYIATTYGTGCISILNAKLETNIGNVLYYSIGMQQFSHNKFHFTIADAEYNREQLAQKISLQQGDTAPLYNGGNYLKYYYDAFNCNVYRIVDTLPYLGAGWSAALLGERVYYNNMLYEAKLYYDDANSKYVAKWVCLNKMGV